jgi:hypothetical protein
MSYSFLGYYREPAPPEEGQQVLVVGRKALNACHLRRESLEKVGELYRRCQRLESKYQEFLCKNIAAPR